MVSSGDIERLVDRMELRLVDLAASLQPDMEDVIIGQGDPCLAHKLCRDPSRAARNRCYPRENGPCRRQKPRREHTERLAFMAGQLRALIEPLGRRLPWHVGRPCRAVRMDAGAFQNFREVGLVTRGEKAVRKRKPRAKSLLKLLLLNPMGI